MFVDSWARSSENIFPHSKSTITLWEPYYIYQHNKGTLYDKFCPELQYLRCFSAISLVFSAINITDCAHLSTRFLSGNFSGSPGEILKCSLHPTGTDCFSQLSYSTFQTHFFCIFLICQKTKSEGVLPPKGAL